MVDQGISTGPDRSAASRSSRPTGPVKRPIASFEESIALGPNGFATLISFLFLMAAPTLCSEIVLGLIDPGEVGGLLLPGSLPETAGLAAAGALLLLVLGLILQVWQSHRPFHSRWPLVLALPISWGLVAPEILSRGGSWRFWLIMAATIAIAFSVHWLALAALRDTME